MIKEQATTAVSKESRVVHVPPSLTVRDLAGMIGLSPIDIIKQLMSNGIMANINQQIDFDTAAIVGGDLGFEVLPEAAVEMLVQTAEAAVPRRDRFISGEDRGDLKLRPPVVAVLGHVDHGK
jgi:translation initiation factor IF-2